MSELSVIESVRQDYEEYINKQAKVIQWYEKENRHNQEIIIKDVKEIKRLNNIINEFEKWLNNEIKRLKKIQNDKKHVKPYGQEYNNYTLLIGAYDNTLDKLKELKENK